MEIEGISQGAFSEVSGLGVKLEVIEYQDGDDLVLRKRPGRAQYPNITLKALPGQPVLDELWEWYQQVLQGNVQRRSGSVIVLDERSSEVARYNFFEAWPAKWEGPSSVDAGGNAVNVEEIQLAVERIERE